MPSTIEGGLYVRGSLQADSISLPSESVGDWGFDPNDPLTAEKQYHQYPVRYTQIHGTATTTAREVIHNAYAAGEVVQVQAGCVVACVGDSTIVVDIKKNGTSIMSGTITLDSVALAFEEVIGTISVAGYTIGDVFEVVVTAAAGSGTLGQGLYVLALLREAPGA